METNTKTFDSWCIVELFGHSKIAGRCTEQNIAGTNFLRVDVPETDQQPAYSRLFGSAAIYAINPVDEITARLFVKQLNVGPVSIYSGETFTEKYLSAKAALPPSSNNDDEDEIGF